MERLLAIAGVLRSGVCWIAGAAWGFRRRWIVEGMNSRALTRFLPPLSSIPAWIMNARSMTISMLINTPAPVATFVDGNATTYRGLSDLPLPTSHGMGKSGIVWTTNELPIPVLANLRTCCGVLAVIGISGGMKEENARLVICRG